MSGYNGSEIDKVKKLALQMETLHHSDGYSPYLRNAFGESAKWLNKLSYHMCGTGFVGCNGGADCDSDHK